MRPEKTTTTTFGRRKRSFSVPPILGLWRWCQGSFSGRRVFRPKINEKSRRLSENNENRNMTWPYSHSHPNKLGSFPGKSETIGIEPGHDSMICRHLRELGSLPAERTPSGTPSTWAPPGQPLVTQVGLGATRRLRVSHVVPLLLPSWSSAPGPGAMVPLLLLSLMIKALSQEIVRALGIHGTTRMMDPMMTLITPQGRPGLSTLLITSVGLLTLTLAILLISACTRVRIMLRMPISHQLPNLTLPRICA